MTSICVNFFTVFNDTPITKGLNWFWDPQFVIKAGMARAIEFCIIFCKVRHGITVTGAAMFLCGDHYTTKSRMVCSDSGWHSSSYQLSRHTMNDSLSHNMTCRKVMNS